MFIKKSEYFYYNLFDLNRTLFEYDLSYKSNVNVFKLKKLNLNLVKSEKNLRSNFNMLILSSLYLELIFFNSFSSFFYYDFNKLIQKKVSFICFDLTIDDYDFFFNSLFLFKFLSSKKKKLFKINFLFTGVKHYSDVYNFDLLNIFSFKFKYLSNVCFKFYLSNKINIKLKKLILFL